MIKVTYITHACLLVKVKECEYYYRSLAFVAQVGETPMAFST